ncbi:MAG: ABC transporter ATP-binding protein [Candidatus Hydrogenedentes bacterium]|nr:ABC transporter ATP-binding protein [Candidatus Hydrogenedentota bacterium]
MNTEHVIEVSGLSRRFGGTDALRNVDLQVPRGEVFGLVGSNGAGKTTLIKHILGLYRCQRGSVRVYGMDPVKTPEKVLARVGYLSEDRDLPLWMTVRELLGYTKAFYPGWDDAYAAELVHLFRLDPNARLQTLSRGQLAQTGLVAAIAYRPDLLILDEPSAGLDPVVRRDILAAIIRTVADEGRTVLFSSHLLDEVERVCDRIAMIQDGKMVMHGRLDALKEQHHHLILHNMNGHTSDLRFTGELTRERVGEETHIIVEGHREILEAECSGIQRAQWDLREPSLEEIFVAHTGRALWAMNAK